MAINVPFETAVFVSLFVGTSLLTTCCAHFVDGVVFLFVGRKFEAAPDPGHTVSVVTFDCGGPGWLDLSFRSSLRRSQIPSFVR